jgi:hypothetical protein
VSITELIISSTSAAPITKAAASTSSLPGLVTSPGRADRKMADQ